MTAQRKATGIRLDDDLLEGLELIYERDGILPSEQIRRAVRAWLEAKGVVKKPEPRGSKGGKKPVSK